MVTCLPNDAKFHFLWIELSICISELHVFMIIWQCYFISVLTLNTLNNLFEHRQLAFFYSRELLIIYSHYRCISLKGTC